MKRLITILCMFLCIGMCACTASGGKVDNIKIIIEPSEIYTEEEIRDAIETVKSRFRESYKDSTLQEIRYAGDKSLSGYDYVLEWNDVDEVIVLISAFETGNNPGPTLEANYAYKGYNWILGRKKGGAWQYIDNGY